MPSYMQKPQLMLLQPAVQQRKAPPCALTLTCQMMRPPFVILVRYSSSPGSAVLSLLLLPSACQVPSPMRRRRRHTMRRWCLGQCTAVAATTKVGESHLQSCVQLLQITRHEILRKPKDRQAATDTPAGLLPEGRAFERQCSSSSGSLMSHGAVAGTCGFTLCKGNVVCEVEQQR
jgi:hypothetical protein